MAISIRTFLPGSIGQEKTAGRKDPEGYDWLSEDFSPTFGRITIVTNIMTIVITVAITIKTRNGQFTVDTQPGMDR